jgi:CDP-glucose 4,6-dehydratase
VGLSRDFWSGRRVLLTGHTGFKGSWLALWLAELEADVVGFSNGVPTTPSLFEVADVRSRLTSVTGDVRDLAALKRAVAEYRPEVVFHLAAQPLVRASYSDPVTTFETNVLGTVNVLEAARDARAVVNVTTDKVYANDERDAPFREGEPLGGEDPYSASKAASELVTAAYRASFVPAVASARAGNVIGGGDWAEDRLLPDLLAGVLSREPVVVRNPDSVRPWQHVLNVCEGYLLLAERLYEDTSFADAWNFGPDEDDARPVRWIVDRLSALWGEEIRVTAPDEPQPREARLLRLDSSRARERLGWSPRWNLDRAMQSIVEWTRAYAAGDDMQEATLAQIRAFAAVTV